MQSGSEGPQQSAPHKPQFVRIRDLRPAPGNVVNTHFIILEKYASSRMSESGQTVCTALVADHTASVHLLLWGAEVDHLQPGYIVSLTNGIFSFHKNALVLRAGKKGALEKVGEFTMNFVEEPNLSRVQWVQDPANPKHWIPAPGSMPSSRAPPRGPAPLR